MSKSIAKKIVAIGLISVLWLSGCGKDNVDVSVSDEPEVVSGEEMHDATGKYVLDEHGEALIDDVEKRVDIEIPAEDNNRVFYQIFVCSFSDSNGDGVGDLRGIINRLDYLNDGDDASGKSLGIQGIWLSPVFTSPSYHKYDVADYYEIDPEYGTMDDLKELVSLCHERGVKIILDLPINHTSSRNQWFIDFCSAHRHGETDNEYYDFYTYNDSIKLGNRTFYQIPSGEEFYEGNFSSDMPELNYDNEKVREATLDIARYYLEEVGLDGFRFDAAKYNYYGETEKNVEFWCWYMDELKKINPNVYTIAEVWDSDSMTIEYEKALNCFNFTMAQTDGMISNTTKHGDVNQYTKYVEQYISSIKEKNPDARITPFIANHDTDRAAGYMTVASGYARVAANLYILGPGSPFIYYGEEIGIKGSRGGANTDANRRTRMLWGDDDTVKNPIGTTFGEEKQTNGTVAELIGNGDSLYNYYKKLIMIRKANPEFVLGEYKAIKLEDTKVGGFSCTYEGSTVGVFHNTSGSKAEIDLSLAMDKPFTEITDIMGIEDASLNGTILTLGGQTSVVMR